MPISLPAKRHYPSHVNGKSAKEYYREKMRAYRAANGHKAQAQSDSARHNSARMFGHGEFGDLGRPGPQSPIRELVKGDFSEQEIREIKERVGIF